MAARSSSIVNAFAVQPDADTAATGPFTALLKRSGGFSSTTAEIDEGTETDTLLASATLPGSKTHTAQFTCTFRELIYDDFLRSAYAADWVGDGTNDLMTMGKTPVYLTFAVETSYLNDPNRHYTLYTGCQVSNLAFAFPQDGVITMTMDIGAANKSNPTTAPWGSLVQPANKNPLRTCTALTSVRIDGNEVQSVIENNTYTIARANEEIFDSRQCDPAEIILGTAAVSGNINAYHDDECDQWHRDADNDVKYAIDHTITGETKTYRFNTPIANNKSPGFDPTGANVTVDLPFGAETTPPTINRDNV